MITGKVAKIGEKMTVRRFVRYEAEGGLVESYIHMGGKVGVLLKPPAKTPRPCTKCCMTLRCR